MEDKVSEHDLVVLIDLDHKKMILEIKDELRRIKGLGVYNSGELIGKEYGRKIKIGNTDYLILKPSIDDKMSSIQRKAQIILPKDSVHITYYCDVKPGDTVIEGGIGSGALTMLLANLVKPDGKVISYENREEFAKIARKNLKEAGLEEFSIIKKGDITKGIEEREVDAVVLDIPNPWDAVKNAYNALKIGGYFASYSPTLNQVEKTVRAMRDLPLIEIRTLETLQRNIVVTERGIRPSFEMLGHTGYVTFGRKVAD